MGEWAYETDPEFAYESTDIEDELFLAEVPLNLLQKSIESIDSVIKSLINK